MKTDLYWVETGSTGRLATMARPRAGDWLEDEMRGLRAMRVDVVVSLLTDDEVSELDLGAEPQACELAGLTFRRFPIPDREVPPLDSAVTSLAHELRDAITTGKSVAIHCRMGIGRASLIASASERSASSRTKRSFA
ncbi:MAG: hypothetical protein Q8N23_34575 [Archangium sp.]|nr:hypothetical protein [Archangium sp.]MDP3571910.1 hypothetical protein [Archangium sp.]